MGRRYLSTLLMMFFQRILVADDIRAECSTSECHTQLTSFDDRRDKSKVEADAEERNLEQVLEELQRLQKDLQSPAKKATTVQS